LTRNNVLLFKAIVLAFGLFSTIQITAQRLPDEEENLVFARITSNALSKNVIGLSPEQKIAICLPPSYAKETSKRYPVIYMLAGFNDEASFYTNGMYKELKIQQAIRDLSASGAIKEMIVVVIGGNNFIGGSFFVNSEAGGNWEDYIVNEVVSYIDGNFRTIARPEARGIAGNTMGGFGAITIGIKHPEIFTCIYALCPWLFDKNGLGSSQMFSDQIIIDKFLKCEKENSALPKDKAKEKLINFCDNSRDMELLFTIAYGIAFAPNASKNAPYIDFPYSKSSSKGNLNKEIWKKWDNGFGNWETKIKTYKDNLLKIKGIEIDYDTNDEYKWMVDGCKNLIKLLTAEKIQIKSVSFSNGQPERLRERVEKFMLPFFSSILDFNQ